MNDPNREFLMELLRTPSPSGWESAGQKLWMEKMRACSDHVDCDAHGNAWAHRNGSGTAPLMLEAHADEIGFIVRHIDSKGFITLAPLGGSDRAIAPARRATIFGDKGPVPAVIAHTAIHLRDQDKDKVNDWHDLYADAGASSDEHAAEMGLRVGHPAVYRDEPEEWSNNRILSRALDNKIGGYILARIFENLAQDTETGAAVVAVNAVQEEIGSQGAKMMAHRLQPRAAIVFDVTHATDVPNINPKAHGLVTLGGGPALSHGGANHPMLIRRLIDIAAQENIPLQHEAVSRCTRTDTDVIYTAREGIPSVLISVPLRNMHSPVEIIDLADVENAAALVTAFIRALQPEDAFFALS